MKAIIIKAFIVLLFSMIISDAFPQKPNVEQIKKDVYYLASDSLEGRRPGSAGFEKAADYIRKEFKSSGMTLLGDDGYQYFEVVTDIRAGSSNSLSFKDFEGKPGTDFTPFSFSASTTVSGEVIFAGYGFDFTQDTQKWNDYKNVDVTGKWVLLFRGNPEPDNDKSIFAPYSSERSKVLTAKDKGAIGVLFISGVVLDKSDELVSLYYDNSFAGAGIPVIHIKREVANRIISPAGTKVEDIENEINKTRKPKSFASTCIVKASTEVIITKSRTENVVAMVQGTDPVLKDEYIVVGAHFDHLGRGGPGSGSRTPENPAIHNGADDNASGTSVILALARSLHALKSPLKTSVVLVAFSAEEMGVLGSSWFVSHPLIDMKKVKLMMNFDMVGRMSESDPVLCISGTGTASEFAKLFPEYTKDAPFKTAQSPEGYGPSDHSSFYAADIPVLNFFTAAHMDYHTPNDDADLLNYKGLKDIADFANSILCDVAGNKRTLTFQQAGPKAKPSGEYRTKIRLGIMPDFAKTDVKGVAVGGVTPGGPSEHSGIAKGDVIVALDGKKVESIYEYMDRIKGFIHGQTITVDVLRGNEKKVFLIQL